MSSGECACGATYTRKWRLGSWETREPVGGGGGGGQLSYSEGLVLAERVLTKFGLHAADHGRQTSGRYEIAS